MKKSNYTLKEKTIILEISQHTAGAMNEECLNKVKKDFGGYFLDMYGRARSIAAEKQKNNEELTIIPSHWEEAKWKTQISWGQKKKLIVKVMDFILLLGPVVLGYSFSNPKELWWAMASGFVITAVAFIIKLSHDK